MQILQNEGLKILQRSVKPHSGFPKTAPKGMKRAPRGAGLVGPIKRHRSEL